MMKSIVYLLLLDLLMKLFYMIHIPLGFISTNIKLEFPQSIQLLPRKNSSTCNCLIATLKIKKIEESTFYIPIQIKQTLSHA